MLQAPIDPIAAVSHPDPYPYCAALRAHAGIRRHLGAGLSALATDAQRAAAVAVDVMEGLLPLLASNGVEGLGVAMEDIAALGVRRVSVGGALARTAWGAFAHAARLMAEQGRFDGFANALPGEELDSFFRSDLSGREGTH